MNEPILTQLSQHHDKRGYFAKCYCENPKLNSYDCFKIKEVFYSTSTKNSIRGLHYQSPPFYQSKIITCISGVITDVCVDLRNDTFGNVFTYKLNSTNSLYIPPYFAHGFKVLSQNATILYLCNEVYQKDQETGILYDSINFDWGLKNPIISERDLSFEKLAREFHMLK